MCCGCCCMCVYVYVSVCPSVCLFICMKSTNENLDIIPQLLSISYIFSIDSPSSLCWLPSEGQGSACLHLPSTGITIAFKHSHFLKNFGSGARTQVLQLAEQNTLMAESSLQPSRWFFLAQLLCFSVNISRALFLSPLLAFS